MQNIQEKPEQRKKRLEKWISHCFWKMKGMIEDEEQFYKECVEKFNEKNPQ